jgi:SRSO17 transposase
METKRNMSNIGRKTNVSGQNVQHFMSNSPWSGWGLIAGVRDEIKVHPEFESGAMLVLDESADEKAGPHSAGAGRQHNGRLGKIDMSQVGVFLSLVTPQVNTWVDGELFIPADWFEEAHTAQRQKVGIPEERCFQTKPELGWQMIQRVQAQGVPFEAVVMDDLYGRNTILRQQLDQAGIEYYGDIPANTFVYLEPPQLQYPLTQRGKPSKNPVIVGGKRCEVRKLLRHPDLAWQTITLRPNERGLIRAKFARRRIWLVMDHQLHEEWLLIRKDANRVTYIFSNASPQTSLKTMAWRKSHRYFGERSNQDAKGEFGWDEFQAMKYRAWEHQLALTILAGWFVAETRLDWMNRYHQDPDLLAQLEVDVLPQLSVGNVRELLRAALPLPQLSSQQAADLVVSHLLNRTRSRKSRLRQPNFKASTEM